MSAIRRTMLCAFAGGCLTNAVLFGVWRVAEGHSSGNQAQSNHVVERATAAPSVAVAVSAVDRGDDSSTRGAPPPVTADLDSAAATPTGSAVSDVLTRLEAAYRERAATPTPVQASQAQPAAAAPPENVLATAEAVPSASAQPPAAVVPATLAVVAASQVAPAAPTAAAPVTVAPSPVEPQVAPAAPAIALQDAPPPTVVQYGDVNQNTYITNVREGDVYQIQMQQIAVLQYMQLLGMSGGAAAPARRAGGAGRQQRGALSSGITNPDNPWGFHFAPLNLVR